MVATVTAKPAPESPPPASPMAVADAKVVEEQKIILELAPPLRRYTRGSAATSKVFEAEKAYRFTVSQAVILLAEVQEPSGLPIWRRYKPKPQEAERIQQVLTGHKPTYEGGSEEIKAMPKPDVAIAGPLGRLDIGTDEEVDAMLEQATAGPKVVEESAITIA